MTTIKTCIVVFYSSDDQLIKTDGQGFKGKTRKASAHKSGDNAGTKEGVFQWNMRLFRLRHEHVSTAGAEKCSSSDSKSKRIAGLYSELYACPTWAGKTETDKNPSSTEMEDQRIKEAEMML